MEPYLYKRPITFKTQLYRVITFIYFLSLLLTTLKGKVDYSILVLLLYSITEIMFNPKSIELNDSVLSITKQYLGGLVKRRNKIHFSNIVKVYSINLDGSNDSNPDAWTGGIWPGNGAVPFGLYQMQYLDSKQAIQKINLNLYPNEYSRLQELLSPTTIFNNWDSTE